MYLTIPVHFRERAYKPNIDRENREKEENLTIKIINYLQNSKYSAFTSTTIVEISLLKN